MAALQAIPAIVLPAAQLQAFGQLWTNGGQKFTKKESMAFGVVFDKAVADALAVMLGNIAVVKPNARALMPAAPDVVEHGACRIAGGVRAQNFDVGYRPDGVRFAFDSKTLNMTKSFQKNYQNMVNDLGTEATTVHTRFPYAVVSFLVAIPHPCLTASRERAVAGTLERLTLRASPLDSVHKAEAISLVVWHPSTGLIDPSWPSPASPLRVQKLSRQIQRAYVQRYKGLPPHD